MSEFNPYELVITLFKEIPNRRMRDILIRRFGLHNGQRQTLELIGQRYGITRERVRQIEKNGIAILSKSINYLRPAISTIQNYLNEYGKMRREAALLEDLSDGSKYSQSAIYFILSISRPFYRFGETSEFYPLWTINKRCLNSARRIIYSLVRELEKKKEVAPEEEIIKIGQNIGASSVLAVRSYIDACKLIDKNSFGEIGLSHWPEIRPRGVKDKAYLVLKKIGRPLHFTELAKAINETDLASNPVNIQTVHNELIKDPRFILIGRGIYALNEWDYESGTVLDVIKKILANEGPLTKEEIIKRVLEKKLIKENTVLINLQNKKYFRREGNKYSLV